MLEGAAVEQARKVVIVRLAAQLVLDLPAFVDDPDTSLGAYRPAIFSRYPDARVLDPELAPVSVAAGGDERIDALVGYRLALGYVAICRQDNAVARLAALGSGQGFEPASGEMPGFAFLQTGKRSETVRPFNAVSRNIPDVEGLARGTDDFPGSSGQAQQVSRNRVRAGSRNAHLRPVLQSAVSRTGSCDAQLIQGNPHEMRSEPSSICLTE